YSGQTEETLINYDQAREKGAIVAVVSSGGSLIEKSTKDNVFVKPLPPGYSSPRACLGYSFFALMSVLKETGVLPDQVNNEVEEMVDFIRYERENIEQKGKALAPYLVNRKLII